MIDTGVYPGCLKVGRVIPIHKEGPLSDPNNYRLISLIPVIGKIFEKVLHSRLMSFLIKNDVLSKKKQLGFIWKLSTIDALVEVVERICELRYRKQVSHCTLLDLSKAFDTVDHKLLVRKCEIYGLRGQASSVLTSYLSNPKQFVDFNGETLSNLGVT